MKKMMIATLLLATWTSVNAQDTVVPTKPTQDPAVTQQRAAEKADKRTEEMTQELGLSAEQVPKVDGINSRFAKSMAELKQAGLAEEAQKERGKVLRQNRDNELKAVLTKEQFEKMIVLRKEKKAEQSQEKDVKAPHNE